MNKKTYRLLDSGNFSKLEDVGGQLIVRPCPQAVWKKMLPQHEWGKAKDTYLRSNTGGGRWQKNSLPQEWQIEFQGMKMNLRPTNFGHLGLFPEHSQEWAWLEKTCRQNPGMTTLNLFAYTGGSSLAMARGGANCTHVDAAKGIVDWARKNAALNNIDNVRWIVDDVQKFLQREIRREKRYQGIVLDPPTYGRGTNKEIWQIEEDILPLLDLIKQLLDPNPRFILFSCHTPHFTPKTIENIFRTSFSEYDMSFESGEMGVSHEHNGMMLPVGFYCKVLFN